MLYDEAIINVGNIRNRFQILLLFGLTYRWLKIDAISILFMTLKSDFNCDWVDTLTSIGMSYNISCGPYCFNQTTNKCQLRLNSSSDSRVVKCTRWRYDNNLTMISELNLVCDQNKWINIIQSSMWFGMVFGIVLGPIADRFGRRLTIIGSSYLDIICSILMIFANGPWTVVVLRFILGVLVAESKISLINFQELSNTDSRVVAGNVWWFIWVIGYSLTPLWAFLFPYWRHMQICLTIMISLICLQPLYVPESPRWLLTRKRYKYAQDTMDWLCKVNKVDHVALDDVKIERPNALPVWKIIKHGGVIPRILFTLVSWGSMSLLYYGISLNVKFATENPYISTFLMGVAEFPSIPLGFFISRFLGYRIGLYILVLMTSLMTVIIPWIRDLLILRVVLAFIGKVSITAAYSLIIIYTGELFSTAIRNTGMSFNCLCKLVVTIIPYINDMKNVHFFIPAAIYALFGIVICLVIVPFPETKGAPLIHQIEDMPKLKWKIFKHPSSARVASNKDTNEPKRHIILTKMNGSTDI